LLCLNWKSDKSQIKLTRNSGALSPCVLKPASFLPACDQFIITPEETGEKSQVITVLTKQESKLCASYFQNFPGTSTFRFYLPARLWSST